MKEYRVMIGEGGVFGLGSPVSTCGVFYIAFIDKDGSLVEERGRMLIPCSEDIYRSYCNQIKPYTVMRIRAGKKEELFDNVKVLEINAAPMELEKSFLDQAQLPVFFEDQQFGLFTYDKALNWFEGSITYEDRKVSVSLEEKENIETLRWFVDSMETLMEQAKNYAAEELLDLGNDWSFDAWEGEEEDFIPMTAADFAAKIRLNSITLSEEGTFSLWYDDGDIFWGHSICVDGDREEGFNYASMQG